MLAKVGDFRGGPATVTAVVDVAAATATVNATADVVVQVIDARGERVATRALAQPASVSTVTAPTAPTRGSHTIDVPVEEAAVGPMSARVWVTARAVAHGAGRSVCAREPVPPSTCGLVRAGVGATGAGAATIHATVTSVTQG